MTSQLIFLAPDGAEIPYVMPDCPFWSVKGGGQSLYLWLDKISNEYVLSSHVGQRLVDFDGEDLPQAGYIFNGMPVWRDSSRGEVWWSGSRGAWIISAQAGWFHKDPDSVKYPDYTPNFWGCSKESDSLPDGEYLRPGHPGDKASVTLKGPVDEWRRPGDSMVGEYTQPGKPSKYVGFRKFKDAATGHTWCDASSEGRVNSGSPDHKYPVSPEGLDRTISYGSVVFDVTSSGIEGYMLDPRSVSTTKSKSGWIIQSPEEYPRHIWFQEAPLPSSYNPSGDYARLTAYDSEPLEPERYRLALDGFVMSLPEGSKTALVDDYTAVGSVAMWGEARDRVSSWNFPGADWESPDPANPEYYSALISALGERADMALVMAMLPAWANTSPRPGDQYFRSVSFDFEGFDTILAEVAEAYTNHEMPLSAQIDSWLVDHGYGDKKTRIGEGADTFIKGVSDMMSFEPTRWNFGTLGQHLGWSAEEFMVPETCGWSGKPMEHIKKWIKARYDAINHLRDIWKAEALHAEMSVSGVVTANYRRAFAFNRGFSKYAEDESGHIIFPCAVTYFCVPSEDVPVIYYDTTTKEDVGWSGGALVKRSAGIYNNHYIEWQCGSDSVILRAWCEAQSTLNEDYYTGTAKLRAKGNGRAKGRLINYKTDDPDAVHPVWSYNKMVVEKEWAYNKKRPASGEEIGSMTLDGSATEGTPKVEGGACQGEPLDNILTPSNPLVSLNPTEYSRTGCQTHGQPGVGCTYSSDQEIWNSPANSKAYGEKVGPMAEGLSPYDYWTIALNIMGSKVNFEFIKFQYQA